MKIKLRVLLVCVLFAVLGQNLGFNNVQAGQNWGDKVLHAIATTSNVTQQTYLKHDGQPLAPLDTATPLYLTLALKERDSPAFTAFIADLYNPGSPNYRHFIGPQEYGTRFGPTATTRQQASDWLFGQGFSIVSNNPLGSTISFKGTAGQAAVAFGVQIHKYQRTDGSSYFANDRSPAWPRALAGNIIDVFGLSNELTQHHNYQFADTDKTKSSVVMPRRGPNGTNFTPAELRSTYSIPAAYTGAGRTIALYELGGYDPQNVDVFDQTFGLPTGNRQDISIDGQPTSSNDGDIQVEVELDIEVANAIAPQARVLVYCAPLRATGLAGYLDLSQRIATDNLADTISQSYGQNEVNFLSKGLSSFLEAENNIFRQQAAQGQSMFTSSGDSGSGNTPPLQTNQIPQDPATQPYLTSVGGTRLYVSGNATTTTYLTEAVWNRGIRVNADGNYQGDGGGGGISQYWPASTVPWQSGPGVNNPFAANQPARQYPDVSADADPTTGYAIFTNNAGTTGWFTIGGTSAASPLWAAFITDADAIGGKRLGLINPALYKVLQNGAQARNDFHDITQGNNDPFCVPGSGYCDDGGPFYPATSGYDIASGIGTPIVSSLVPDLINLGVSGSYLGLDSYPYLSADLHGPAVSKTISLTSMGGRPINYNASSVVTTTAQWLTVSPASGTISGTQPLVLTANPGNLAVGDYVAILTVSGTANGQNVPPVVAHVYLKVGTLHVSVSSLDFNLSDSGPNYVTQTVTITTTADVPQTYAVEAQDFLGFVTINGFIFDSIPGFPIITVSNSQPVSLTFGVLLDGPTFFGSPHLAPGAYTANLNLISVPLTSIDQVDIGLNLKVSGQNLSSTPLTLNFAANPGGNLPPPQIVTVTASPVFTAPTAVPVTATLNSEGFANYFTVSPTVATIAPGGTLTFTVTPLTTNLGGGYYNGYLNITSGLDSSVVARTNLVYNVQPQPHLAVTTPLGAGSTDLVFNASSDSPGVFSQIISLTALNGSVSYTTTTGVFGPETPWLNVAPASDTIALGETNPVRVSIDTTHLGVGTYQGYVQIYDLTNPKGDGPLRIAVLVKISGTRGATSINYPLPRLSNGPSVHSYVTVQNLGFDPANVVVSYFNYNGTPLTVVTTTVPSGGQKILPQTAIPPGSSANAVLASNQPLNVLVTEGATPSPGSPTSSSAYNVSPIITSANLYDPVALNGAFNGFVSSILLYNPGDTANSGLIQYYDQNGQAAPTSDHFTLAPHATVLFDQDHSVLSRDKAYFAVISSTTTNSQLTALVTEVNAATNFRATFQASPKLGSILFVPTAYNHAFNGFSTGIAMANPNSVPVTATIAYLDSTGFLNGLKQVIIPAHGLSFSYTPDSTPTNFVGSAAIYATSPIVATVNEAGSLGSGTYLALATASQNLGLPAVANNYANFYTGASLFNVSSVPIQVALQYANPDGTAVGPTRIYTVQSGASLLVYQGADNLPDGFFGTLLISSSTPESIVVAVNAAAPATNLFYTYTEPGS